MKKFTLIILLVASCFIVFSQNQPKGISVNDTAPDFLAKDQNGKSISLSQQLTKGAVVLVFYRGEWCPFCNKELKSLEDSLSFLQQKKATVIAVTPEKPENISKTIEKTKASYSILHDDGLKIMNNYGVAFKVDSLTNLKYKSYGIDFMAANGSTNRDNLPIPAVYIINKKGKVIYRYFDADYRKRPTVKELLSHL